MRDPYETKCVAECMSKLDLYMCTKHRRNRIKLFAK